jgi:hypothetical protein
LIFSIRSQPSQHELLLNKNDCDIIPSIDLNRVFDQALGPAAYITLATGEFRQFMLGHGFP